MLVPKLRFKRENGTEYPKWNNIDFWNAVSINGSLVDPRLPEYQNMLHIGTANIEKNTGRLLDCQTALEEGITSGKYLFDETCVVYSKIRPELNKATYPKFCGLCSADAYPLKPNNGILPEIILSQLLGRKFYKYVTSTSARTKMPKVNQEELSGYSFTIPCLEEQQKIANFLSTVDEVVAQSEAEVQNLEQQKKAAMQKIFSQKVRFKREDGTEYPEWEELAMSEIFTEIIEKNRPDLPVLSILQGQGTVYRDSSDRNIMYDKKSTVNYKAMRKGDFIIHLRTFEGGLECATLDGISSPAYKILRTDKLIPEAYKAYFRSKQFIEGRLAIAVTGVRDGKNIEMSTFWQILVPVACLEEQQKIADFLSAYDEAISYAKQELEHWKQLKKGLLQQMFV
ncbi:MAG: restriction endonuclease subunit S [Ruminococcus sp.]|nr:restriction endonuclease subunit S [Ruminococcus sp.]